MSATTKMFSALAGHSVALLVATIVVSTFALYSRIRVRRVLDALPLARKELGSAYARRNEFLRDPMRAYREGYEKFRGKAFRVTHYDGERIVVPTSALDELWNAPETISNKNRAYDQRVLRQYTGLPSGNPFLVHCIRSDLTRNLARINDTLISEVEITVDDVLGPCKDWTSHVIYRSTLRIVAIVSGSVFVGSEHCRNEQFIYDSMHFTESVIGAVHRLQTWPSWFRTIARFFKSERAQLAKSWKHMTSARQLFIPMIRQRREDVNTGRASYNDMLAWMMAKADKWEQSDDDVAGSLVQLGVASVHNTTMTVIQTLYQLAIRPELVDELRQEIRSVIAIFNGELSPHALFEMKLLDSVMKEAQRMNPTTPSHFHRYVEKDYTLKDGTLLPAGITIDAIFAPVLFDPNVFPNPETFDPYRFLKLRTGETPDPNHYSNKEQYVFSHATKENLAWGYGAHSCPGRYFANNEIKLILARMLLRYDIRVPGAIKDAYKPQRAGMGWTPDVRKPLEFKAVKKEDK